MPSFINEGIEAWVEVNGERLDEYGIDEAQDENGVPVVVCWIPSKSEQKFTIGLSIPARKIRSNNYGLYLYMDGNMADIPNGCVLKDRTIKEPLRLCISEELAADGKTARNFRFCSLQPTDDEDHVDREIGGLGEIKIKMTSVARILRKPYIDPALQARVDSRTVREHHAKGLSHYVDYGDEKPFTADNTESVTYVGSAHICSFKFFYRDIDTLVAEGRLPVRDTASSRGTTASGREIRVRPQRMARSLDGTEGNVVGLIRRSQASTQATSPSRRLGDTLAHSSGRHSPPTRAKTGRPTGSRVETEQPVIADSVRFESGPSVLPPRIEAIEISDDEAMLVKEEESDSELNALQAQVSEMNAARSVLDARIKLMRDRDELYRERLTLLQERDANLKEQTAALLEKANSHEQLGAIQARIAEIYARQVTAEQARKRGREGAYSEKTPAKRVKKESPKHGSDTYGANLA